MSKPLADEADMPPEPEADFPPEPSRSGVAVVAAPVESFIEVDLPMDEASLVGLEQVVPAVMQSEGDVLTVGGARYRLAKRLGAGGMGEVFLARKLGTGGFERDVALKTILPALTNHRTRAEAFLKSFTDEARLAALLTHPNIAQVFDLQPLEGRGLVMVLEFVPGRSLKEIFETARKKRASLTEPLACFIAAELASALHYAHQAADANGRCLGIVHRDVTPHNIMVSTNGTVKLLDFGIAYSALDNREATTSNMVKGKDQYYAPEQLVGSKLDGRCDEFALGLCLYEMLVLKRFFTRSTTDTDTQLHLRIAQLTPEIVEGTLESAAIDPSLKSIIHHALAPNRDERFPTCGEFGDALRVFSQRRGWLFTAADAAKEVEALFALPDAPDAEKTNPSGPKLFSAAPRRVPRGTTQLPPLTPGRTALTPADGQKPEAVALAASPSPAVDDSDEPLEEASHSVAQPSPTALRRRLQLQEELHNPQTGAKKMLALPAAILAATLLVGVVLVKFLLLSSTPSSSAVEVVKTPEQVRAEREMQERANETATPPQLAMAPVTPDPVAITPPAVQPAAQPRPATRRPAGADAKAVDALLQQQYGGRPVVTRDAPTGAVNAPAPVPAGPRRRSLDTMSSGDPTEGGQATAPSALTLPRGATLAARLTSPADSAQPSPVTAIITADFSVNGAVAVPKGSTLVCTTLPGLRLGLNCDTLNLRGGGAVSIDAIALGADRRVGFPLAPPPPTDNVGEMAKDAVVQTARTALGRVTPDGVAGDVANAAADTAAGAARSPRSGSTAPSQLIPSGTPFALFLQTALTPN